jgi:hypothetical protein
MHSFQDPSFDPPAGLLIATFLQESYRLMLMDAPGKLLFFSPGRGGVQDRFRAYAAAP